MPSSPAIEERNWRIVALALDNVPPRDIAPRFGVSPGFVCNVLHLARKAGVAVPRFDGGKQTESPPTWGRRVKLAGWVLDALAPDADKRGVVPVELARRIVETVARDGMVNAVLDDT